MSSSIARRRSRSVQKHRQHDRPKYVLPDQKKETSFVQVVVSRLMAFLQTLDAGKLDASDKPKKGERRPSYRASLQITGENGTSSLLLLPFASLLDTIPTGEFKDYVAAASTLVAKFEEMIGSRVQVYQVLGDHPCRRRHWQVCTELRGYVVSYWYKSILYIGGSYITDSDLRTKWRLDEDFGKWQAIRNSLPMPLINGSQEEVATIAGWLVSALRPKSCRQRAATVYCELAAAFRGQPSSFSLSLPAAEPGEQHAPPGATTMKDVVNELAGKNRELKLKNDELKKDHDYLRQCVESSNNKLEQLLQRLAPDLCTSTHPTAS